MTAPKKIVFAPGVLEQMEKDFDPAELQEAMDEIRKLADEEYLVANSVTVDMTQLMREDPNLYAALTRAVEESDLSDGPTLQ